MVEAVSISDIGDEDGIALIEGFGVGWVPTLVGGEGSGVVPAGIEKTAATGLV